MERPFKAYAPDGTVHHYTTMLDARQACDLAGYTLTPPGEPASAAGVTRLDYRNMSSELIRNLCVQRNIRGYMTMNRDEQLKALLERDALDASMIAGAKPEPAKEPAPPKPSKSKSKKTAEPEPETEPANETITA